MGKLVVNQDKVTLSNAPKIMGVCPFGAITYENGKLDISAACKMCKMCVTKSEGVIEYVEQVKKSVNKDDFKGVCVFADMSNGDIHRVTYELCGKARELADKIGHPVYALVIGADTASAKKLLHYGVDKVFTYENKAFADFRIEPYTAAFCDFIEKIKPSSVLVGATNLGRALAPRVAARCRCGLTADCTVLDMKENTDLVQIRPAFGGNIMAQIISTDTRPQFCTVRYKIFSEPTPTDNPNGEIVSMAVTDKMLKSEIEVYSTEDKPRDVDISDADVIVAVGRGAMSENLRAQAAELAELLGGVVACTRPLAEANIYNSKQQIGLSGRTVKPKFIICLGISGVIQFAAGMKESECIVAVNTDKNAPIFDVAHYVIVGDVAEILPRIINKIKEVRGDV